VKFRHVHLAALARDLPERSVSSAELEAELAPLYERLGLSQGRLELFTGIRERRLYDAKERPSSIAARAGARALERSAIPRERIGLLVHASVCRDFLEPATAAAVHRSLELPPSCALFDLSNACLGFLDALCLAGQAIDAGSIEAALVVSGENGAPLIESTLRELRADPRADRARLKRAFASLTIGAGGAAAVLVREDLAPDSARLLSATALVDTRQAHLCQGDRAGEGGLWMETDSEALLREGNALALHTWRAFLAEVGWNAREVERVITHQVGSAHRKLLLETLGLEPERDFPSFETLGNMGSASLPVTLDLAREAGFVVPGQRVALLGIGSGLVCRMLALRF
jgi:3-oxoacyl-[acyl-carrier-protein] synthase-3